MRSSILRPLPTSRTLAMLSCALALLAVTPVGKAARPAGATGADMAAFDGAVLPVGGRAATRSTGTPTDSSVRFTPTRYASQLTSPVRGESSSSFRLTMLRLRVCLLAVLGTTPATPDCYLAEVSTHLQTGPRDPGLRAQPTDPSCVPPPPVERRYVQFRCRLAPPLAVA
jgi:hypothetical protein